MPGKFMVTALTPANYVKFATDPFYLAVLARTPRVALVCTVICLALGADPVTARLDPTPGRVIERIA